MIEPSSQNVSDSEPPTRNAPDRPGWFRRWGETHWPIAIATVVAAFVVTQVTVNSVNRNSDLDRRQRYSAQEDEQANADRALAVAERDARVAQARTAWSAYTEAGRTLVSQYNSWYDYVVTAAASLDDRLASPSQLDSDLARWADKHIAYRADTRFTARRMSAAAATVRFSVGDELGVCADEVSKVSWLLEQHFEEMFEELQADLAAAQTGIPGGDEFATTSATTLAEVNRFEAAVDGLLSRAAIDIRSNGVDLDTAAAKDCSAEFS